MKAERGLIILAVIFIGLVGLLLLQQNQRGSISLGTSISPDAPTPLATASTSETTSATGATSAPGSDVPNRIFEGWTGDNVQAMRFEDPSNEDALTLLRNEEGRWIALELSTPINQTIAQGLANTIAILPYRDALPGIIPERYDEFGLTVERVYLLITVILDDGEVHVVAIGESTLDNEAHYILVDERETIYTSPAQPIAFLMTYPAEATRIDG